MDPINLSQYYNQINIVILFQQQKYCRRYQHIFMLNRTQ